MKKFALMGLVVLSFSPFAQNNKAPEPEAFTKAKQMVGGVWRGKVGDKMPVEVRFKLVDNGQVVESAGIVGDPAKPVLKMRARMGVDPITNKVFYLDEHNGTTIYFGHITLENGSLVFDFTALSGDKGHWIARQKFPTADSYESTLYVVGEDGKETAMHPLTLSRSKN